jgi:Listeria-Bacteroides repeat domain (List_Bact_rpt)
MSAWIKKTTGTTQSAWGKASKIWVKTSSGNTQASWNKIVTGWVKVTNGNTQAAWRKFFINKTDVPNNTVAPSITAANYATTNLSGSKALLGTTLTGDKGTWTSANGTISYAYLWFADDVSTGINTTTFSTTGYDGKNIRFQVTATNNSGSTIVSSPQLQVTKNKPVNTLAYLSSNSPNVGDVLSVNTNWTSTTTFTNDTLPDYYIATFTTNAGTFSKDSRTNSSWYQYTVLSSDVNHTISAYVTAYNTGAPLGVSTTTLTTNTIVINPGAFTYALIDTSANRGPGTPVVTSSVSNNVLYLDWSGTQNADKYREYLNSGPIPYTEYYPVAGPSSYTSDNWTFSSSGTESITFYAYNTLNGQIMVSYQSSANADYVQIYYRVGSSGPFTLSSNLSGTGGIYFINAPIGTPVYVVSVVAYNNNGGSTPGTLSSGSSPITPQSPTPTSVTNTYSLTYTPPSYTVTWNPYGGSVSPTSSTATYGSTVTAPLPTRSGYTFLQWRDTPSGDYTYSVNAGASWTVTGNITFYARWTAIPPTCTPSCGSFGSESVYSDTGWGTCSGGSQSRTIVYVSYQTCTASDCSTYQNANYRSVTSTQSCGCTPNCQPTGVILYSYNSSTNKCTETYPASDLNNCGGSCPSTSYTYTGACAV